MPLLAYFADVAAASRLLQPQNAWKKSGNRASCRTHTHRQSTHTQAPIKPEKKGKNVARFFLWHCKAKGKRGKNFAPAVCKVFLSCGLAACVCVNFGCYYCVFMHARILWMSLAMEAGYTDMIYGLKAAQKRSVGSRGEKTVRKRRG